MVAIKRRNIIYADDTPEYEEFRQSALGHPSQKRTKHVRMLARKAKQRKLRYGI
ncbi:hypothetical protein OZX69_01460 [Lactobacillus sp. ESL0731]|uniref:hypothetical protein n=1 Tax=unclassified Lactobacillus TaxID=2620435 RepID=UPI0023F8866B|nr:MULTISPECIES: hypothetical protein [unclassified Lactobacillus]WEV51417.1 hypothetical protein OZX63_01460 [Lactobacillus sp. ESL0700]WEV62547.1 hypothetical protein OZX69_01460 [Lactobacillus sp. ESL0731]